MLVARANEQRRIHALLDTAREGMSGALVLVGEPGIGKTALLERAARRAEGFRILRASGVQSEAELPFAALLDACRPILDTLGRLEPRQDAALRAAFGLSIEQAPTTPFEIGAATLSLLATAAEDAALLLLVDDAHWLDRASADAFAFAVRRLHADAVVALFAMRPGEGRPFSGRRLPELELEALDPLSAAELLAEARSELNPGERSAIVELAQGNPLGLLELPRDTAGLLSQAEPARIGKQLERAFRARADSLPPSTRQALVVAAAATTADAGAMQEALATYGLSLEALEPAEAAGLLVHEAGALSFRHPLVRAALYHAADPADQRRAHAALAAAHAGDDRRAWHLAAAAPGPDPVAAGALERAADAATRRSGFAAAAAAYERSARLSEPGADRQRRLGAAADSAWLGGRTSHAASLIEEALAHTEETARRGELLHLRGTIEHFGGSSVDAAATLEEASGLLAGSNPHLACLSLTEANGSLLAAGEVRKAVELSKRLVEIADPAEPGEFLLASLGRGSALFMDGQPQEGLPFLRAAAESMRTEAASSDPRNLPWAAMAAYWLGDIPSMTSYADAATRWAREHTAVATLTFAARLLGRAQLITGRWPAARASLEESLEAARLADLVNQQAQSLAMLAWLDGAQGHQTECLRRLTEAWALAEQVNLVWRNDMLRALLVLELGTGIVVPPPVDALRGSFGTGPFLRDTPASATTPDVVEALIRAGDSAAATQLLEAFTDEAECAGQPYPRAAALRCRGLLAPEHAYEAAFERALELHASDVNAFATARTRLAYGERLRRSGRRIDARGQFKPAITAFDRLGAAPWSERARNELRATGERVRARAIATREELTPQELQVAILAAHGSTNREIGTQLFLSPKTIEWHLSHVYRKLGISSRGKLLGALTDQQLVSPH